MDLKALGEKSIQIDCDVIQADGGTRTASITGGFVALALALQFLKNQGQLASIPLKEAIWAAISVGLLEGRAILDLNYEEDSACGTDMNFVMTGRGQFVEVQGTAEGVSFSKEQMDQMAELALVGCNVLVNKQAEIIGSILTPPR